MTFLSPSWRSLNLPKGSLNHPKKATQICQVYCVFSSMCLLPWVLLLAQSKQKEIGKFETPFPAFFQSFFRVRQGIGKAFDNETGAFVKLPKADLEGKLVKFSMSKHKIPLPICSMYGIFTYIWLKSMVNVSKYSIPQIGGHGPSAPF